MAKDELDMMIAAEEERFGIGSKEFMDRHVEIIDMCEAAQKANGGYGEMKNGINSDVRKENYGHGLQHGNKVFCGQDLRDLVGLRISDVTSDENDMNVIMYLEDESKMVAMHFDNLCFDGESISTVVYVGGNCECLFRPVTEADLQEINKMTRYYDNELKDEDGESVGVNHVYCNDNSLEGTEQFKVKSLYVFYDGRIMTEERV